MSTVSVSFGSFSLSVSSEWSLSSVILAGPPDDIPEEDPRILAPQRQRPFQRNLVATLERVKPDDTAEAYVRRQQEGLFDAGVPTEFLGAELVYLPDGNSGVLSEQVITGPSGERVRQMQLVTIKDGIAHTIITSHLDGLPFEQVREEFREMLLSFSDPHPPRANGAD